MTGVEASMPERVGRYELLFPVGVGGMGTVYLARAEMVPGVRRNVAVKLMHTELRANPEIAPQLMAEAKLAARIAHPNVVAVLEAGESPHGVYLVMDYIEGATLAGLLRKARKQGDQLPVRVATKILRDALTGLHAAHELRDDGGRPLDIVHRDFSPHNILVGTDGISRLTDFGIAKALAQVGTTATGIVKGKIGYMSPEQASGQRIDRRSDVWAAGVVAWETLAAKRLFRGTNDAATLLQIVSGKRPPPVTRVRPEVPADLAAAIDEALRHDLNERLATAQELRRRLEAGLEADGGLAEEDEVADYVRELMAEEIDKTRERAVSVIRLRTEIADITAGPEVESQSFSNTFGTSPSPSSFEDPSLTPSSGTQTALTTVTGERRMRSRYWIWAAALAMGGLASIAVTFRAGWFGEPRTKPLASSALITAVPTLSAAAPPAPTAPRKTANGLTVVANAAMAQLVVDGRVVVLPDPTREFSLPAGTDPKHLIAITADGRRFEASLGAGQERVDVTFSDRAPPAAAPAARPRQKPSSPDDELAKSPYGAQ